MQARALFCLLSTTFWPFGGRRFGVAHGPSAAQPSRASSASPLFPSPTESDNEAQIRPAHPWIPSRDTSAGPSRPLLDCWAFRPAGGRGIALWSPDLNKPLKSYVPCKGCSLKRGTQHTNTRFPGKFHAGQRTLITETKPRSHHATTFLNPSIDIDHWHNCPPAHNLATVQQRPSTPCTQLPSFLSPRISHLSVISNARHQRHQEPNNEWQSPLHKTKSAQTLTNLPNSMNRGAGDGTLPAPNRANSSNPTEVLPSVHFDRL